MKLPLIGCFSNLIPDDRSLTCPTHQSRGGEIHCKASSLLRSILCTGGGRLGSFLQHSYSCSQAGTEFVLPWKSKRQGGNELCLVFTFISQEYCRYCLLFGVNNEMTLSYAERSHTWNTAVWKEETNKEKNTE